MFGWGWSKISDIFWGCHRCKRLTSATAVVLSSMLRWTIRTLCTMHVSIPVHLLGRPISSNFIPYMFFPYGHRFFKFVNVGSMQVWYSRVWISITWSFWIWAWASQSPFLLSLFEICCLSALFLLLVAPLVRILLQSANFHVLLVQFTTATTNSFKRVSPLWDWLHEFFIVIELCRKIY